MNQAFEIAGVGLGAQQRALDVIANNIANINTLGFKRADIRFVEFIASARDSANPGAAIGGYAPLSGVSMRTVHALDAQGEIERTGAPLDLAIQGEGFLEVLGRDGQSLLWRGGRLIIQPDGQLATADGQVLRDAILAPDDVSALRIDADGAVYAATGGGDTFSQIGRLSLVRVEDQTGVERLDGGVYRVLDAGALSETVAGETGGTQFVQGGLERSNVELSEEMVRLMLVQRAYAANAQIVQAADQLMAIANTLRR